jgi:hypothetical protein
VTAAWPWIAIAALGAYHGLDPSMGWLFAVALGLQERRRAKVFAALGPIALGHLVSIATVVALIVWARFAGASALLRPAGAAILILFGIFRYVRPRVHPRCPSSNSRFTTLRCAKAAAILTASSSRSRARSSSLRGAKKPGTLPKPARTT